MSESTAKIVSTPDIECFVSTGYECTDPECLSPGVTLEMPRDSEWPAEPDILDVNVVPVRRE